MPGLILFRRRWAISSDDFVYPGIGDGLIRIAWLLALIIILAVHKNGFNCTYGHDLKVFYIGTIVLNGIGLITAIILVRISMKGTMKDDWPRRNINYALYVKLFMFVPEACWVCVSTYWAFAHDYDCYWSVYWTARGAVICSWIIGFLTFVAIAIVFDPLGTIIRSSSTTSASETLEFAGNKTASQIWERRCRILCCCIRNNEDTAPAFTDVGKIVAEFFKDLDLVPTDMAAGLMLVQEKQVHSDTRLAGVEVHGGHPSQQSDPGTRLTDPKSWMTIFNMSHYMKYAMASYGWPFYMYQNLFTGLCGLFTQCRCCSCVRKVNTIFKDNSCQCNTAAIKKISGLQNEDLVYVTFHNRFKEVPFYVALDREKNTVVISIRGTLSLQDALADLSAKGADLEIPGVENSYCHAAMLDCARYIKTQLESKRLLELAFSQLPEGAGLVITGHSLGAGVAAILSVLLKPEYPDLICFSFSPPGGLMSPVASQYTQDFVCSVVVGQDLVPRLGMYTLVDLKVKLLRALCETNQPKYKILASGCIRLICCIGPSQESPTQRPLMRGRSNSKYTEERPLVFQEALRNAEQQLEEIGKTQWPLYPAGQILHVKEVHNVTLPCTGEPQYTAAWSDPKHFDKIVISNKMVTDHIPNTVGRALDQLAQRNYVPSIHVQ